MNPADDLPPTKRPKHFHEVQSAAVEQDPDASTQSLSAAELGKFTGGDRPLASVGCEFQNSVADVGQEECQRQIGKRIYLVSDVGANPLVIDRNEGQDENRAQHISKYGETINLEEVNGTGEHSHEHDESGAHEVPCASESRIPPIYSLSELGVRRLPPQRPARKVCEKDRRSYIASGRKD
ncbi:hypothetical protein FRC07_003283 [Ceratobasidium sp. 392]|nr:hypothetical protein FRC07_003283 [Ceratobasidium sp. 392]